MNKKPRSLPFRILAFAGTGLLIAWLTVFMVNKAFDTKVGFDYDDTIGFSTPAYAAASEKYGPWGRDDTEKFWTEVNGHPERDITKPVTIALAYAARALGCDAVIITARPGIGRKPFEDYWRPTFSEIYFTREKSRIMARDRYLAFFGDSDSDIDEARKAGVIGIRIERNSSSSNKVKYHPGSLGEWIVPQSSGPDHR